MTKEERWTVRRRRDGRALTKNRDNIFLYGLNDEYYESYQEILDRLASYEDSGLSPEEVMEMANKCKKDKEN